MFTPVGLDPIGKIISWDGQTLTKAGPAFPAVTRAQLVEFADLGAVYAWLQEQAANAYCVTYATPKGAGPWFCLPEYALSDERAARRLLEGLDPLPLISRTNDSLRYQVGVHLISVDYDPPVDPNTGAVQAGHPWSPRQVWDALVQVEPLLAGVGHIEVPYSSSSDLRDEQGRVISGTGGCRVMFPAHLAHGKGPRDLMQLLFDRMLAVGLCWPFMDKTGRVSLRTCIDMALYRPAQPDFLGAPRLTGLVRAAGPMTHTAGGVLDAALLIALAGRDRLAGMQRLQEQRLALHELSTERREDWHRAMDDRAVEADRTADLAAARRRRNALLDGTTRSMLPPDWMIHIDRMGWVSVATIVANESLYSGRSTSSPLEPDYPVGDGTPQPGRGKITRRGAHLVVVDYAHGSFAQYALAGSAADFDALIAESESARDRVQQVQQLAPAPVGASEPEPVRFDDPQSQREAQLPVIDAPRAKRFAVTPVVPVQQFAVEAERAVARRGITVVTGLDLQRSVVDRWLRQPGRCLAIGVPSYADAVSMRGMALQARPDATVMIMPGRSTDERAQRAKRGQDVFAYVDALTGEKAGLSDVLCQKQALVRKLLGVGQRTTAPLTCIRVQPGQSPERCPHIRDCGYVKRLAARATADFIIYVNSSLQGEDHPLLGPVLKDIVSSSLVFDPVKGVSSDLWQWSEVTWRRVPALSEILDLAMTAEGYRPDDGVAVERLAAEVGQWAGGLGQITPKLDADAALQMVEQYQVQAQQLVEPAELLPPAVYTAVEAWLEKRAHIRIEAGRVYVTVQEPLRRLAGTSAVLATSPAPTMTIAAARMGTVQIGSSSTVDPVVGTVELDLPTAPGSVRPMLALRASQTMLPSKVLQVGEDTLAGWLHKGARNDVGKGMRHARDVVHLAKLLRETGPGIVLSDFPTEIGRIFTEYGESEGVTFLRFSECSTALFIGPEAPKAVRWALVIGRANPMTGQGLSRAAMDSGTRPDLSGALRARVKARYGFRDGHFRPAPDWMGGEQAWRHAGATAQLDELLMAGVIAPVALVAGWLASLEQKDQLPRMLAVCSQFPLASEQQSSVGVLIDDLKDWTIVPPASLVLRELVNLERVVDIGRKLRVDAQEVVEELEAVEKLKEPPLVYWNDALGVTKRD